MVRLELVAAPVIALAATAGMATTLELGAEDAWPALACALLLLIAAATWSSGDQKKMGRRS